jgi:ADP-ribose pyrophosphatase YjhB (NUDIX family)
MESCLVLDGFVDVAGQPLRKSPNAMRPGANAVIFNGSREVLLEKRADYGVWGLPGGSVEVGESVQESLMREVYEETGIHISITRLTGIYSDPRKHSVAIYPDGYAVHFVTIVFECGRVSGGLRISSESTDIGYFPLAALPDDLLIGHKIRIQDAAARSEAPFIR